MGLDPRKTSSTRQGDTIASSVGLRAYLGSACIPTKTTWDLSGDFTMSSNQQGCAHTCISLERCTTSSCNVFTLTPSTKVQEKASYTALSLFKTLRVELLQGIFHKVQSHSVAPTGWPYTGLTGGKLKSRQGQWLARLLARRRRRVLITPASHRPSPTLSPYPVGLAWQG